MNYKFPKNFWWGSATSGPQSEGTKDKVHKNIWDYWFEVEPYKFHREIGPENTSYFYENYKSDIKFLKKTGHNSFRTSIQWSRLIKDFRTGEVEQKAVEFYNNLIDEMLFEGIEPFINLYHFDMPLELQEIGGWENREVVDMYALYAKRAFQLFGDRVKKWFTFNEPIVHVECGYIYTYHYPMVVDFGRACQVGFNTALASAKAIEEYRKLGFQGDIGIILNLTPSYPRSSNVFDVEAAENADAIFNNSFLEPALLGKFPDRLIKILKEHKVIPKYTEEDLKVIRENRVDLLGVNYYQPRRVKAKENMPNPNSPLMPEWFFDTYDMPGKKINPHRGWEIYYKGIYDIAKNIQNNYGNVKWFIAENGMGVEGEEKFLVNDQVQDDYRIEFLKEHLKWLHKAIEEGANCKGYHMWTFIDSWSWLNSYKNRYGFVSLDVNSGKKTIKKSGLWFKELANNNGF